uniref:Uncharacterized protein n=1 Tax=Arundo donax TaxID=35708 RepID=A0A0A9DE80_ARUDO
MLKQMTEGAMSNIMQEACKFYSLHVDTINPKLFSLISFKIVHSLPSQ